MITLRWKKRKKYLTGYLDINFEGFRKWEKLNLFLTGDLKIDKDTLKAAELIKAKRMIELSTGEYDVNSVSSAKNFLSYYKKQIEINPEYERRSAVYKNLNNYLEKKNIKQITFRDVNENFWIGFKSYLVNDLEFRSATVYTTLSIIKAVLNKACREKVIKTNPLAYVTEKKPKSTRTFLTFSEMKKLNTTPCADANVKNIFFFACYTGLRKSDIKSLKKKNIIDGSIVITMQKTGDVVSVPLDEKAYKYLPDLKTLNPEDYLFNVPAWTTTGNIIHGWSAAAGITKTVTMHTARHTFATLHLTSGTSIEVVSALLGHRDIRETQIYAKIIDERKNAAIKNLPEL